MLILTKTIASVLDFDKSELLGSRALRKKTNRTLFLSPTLPLAAGEEGQVGRWKQSQSTPIASVKMVCQIGTVTKSFTAAETFAHSLKTTFGFYVFSLSAFRQTGKG